MQIQVPPEGNPNSKICLIGEAPGGTEAREGRPFVGRAGNMLDKLLQASMINRRDCYILNVIQERPPSNDISKFINMKAKKPEPTELYWPHSDELQKNMELSKANVFIPLGNVALWALTGKVGIQARRGSIMECTAIGSEGRKVIPTIHPAAALREHLFTYMIIRDLRRAKTQSETPEIILPNRMILTRPTFEEACTYLSQILNEKPTVAFDIETYNGHTSCIAFAKSPYDVMSIPFVYDKGDYFTAEDEGFLWQLIGRVLEDPDIVKVAHTCCFDAGVLLTRHGICTRNLEDISVGHGILYADLPKRLAFQTSCLTEEPYYKDEGKVKGYVSDWDQYWRYNAKDSAVTLECLQPIFDALKKQGNYETYRRQMAIVPSLLFMMERGIRVNVPGLREASKEATVEIVALQAQLDALVTERSSGEVTTLNVNSPPQCKRYFYNILGIPPYRKKKKLTVDEDALRRIARLGYEEAALILKIRKLVKMRGTYLEMKFDKDCRMRCDYNPAGAKTGRISSSKRIAFGTGGDEQNLTKVMKKYMLADEGYVLIEVDLSQAESWVVAFTGPEPSMKTAFEQGIDLHRQTYALMFGMRIDEVSDVPGSSSIGDGKSSERFWGKQFGHSLAYGRGYKSISLKLGIQEKDGRRYVERFHTIRPGIEGRYQAGIKSQLSKNRMVTNCYGRKRRFMGFFNDDMFREAYSQVAQSTVGDKINKDGLTFVYGNDDLKEVELLAQVHDSLLFQVPLVSGWKRIVEIILLIKESLEKPVPWKDPFSIPAEFKIGLNFADMLDVEPNEESLAVAYNKLKEQA